MDEAMTEKYVNSFARSDFDLVGFTALEHRINTAKARPEKQSIRRLPPVSQGEVEGHEDKMLATEANIPCSEI